MANNYTDIVTNAFIQGAAGINPGKATNLAALRSSSRAIRKSFCHG